MNYHAFFLDNIEKNSTVLDIGCGSGELTFDLAKKAKYVVAIDNSLNKINKAIKKCNKENIKYIHGDATTYDFKEKFDYIVLSNVLEHISDRQLFLNRIRNIGKIFLIRVPMINRSWLTMYKKELGLDYKSDPGYHIEYTYDSFQKEIEFAGLKILYHSIQFGEIWAKLMPK